MQKFTKYIAPETGTDHLHGCHVEQTSGEGAFLTNKVLETGANTMKIDKIMGKKIEQFMGFDSYTNPEKIVFYTKKLSAFYQSRSTNYADCLNRPPFIINRDIQDIVAAGYSKNCKAIISINTKIKAIKEIATAKLMERKIEIFQDVQRKVVHDKNVENTNLQFPFVAQKFLEKWLVLNNGNRQISHKEANQLAWKKQRYINGGVDLVTLRSLIKHEFNHNQQPAMPASIAIL